MRTWAILLALLVPGHVAADKYSCQFEIEDGIADTIVSPVGEVWQMVINLSAVAHFKLVTKRDDGSLYLISTDLDPDAGAVSLLSISPDGPAFLSAHGAFPAPAAELFHGTCRKVNW